MKRISILFASILVILCSCSGGSNEELSSDVIYFPMSDYIEVNAESLAGSTVVKEITVNGEKERLEKTMTVEDWLKELELFRQADLNRPSLSTSYETKRSEQFLIHELKPGEKAKIQKVVVKYEDNVIKEVSFHAKSENPFYQNETRGVIFNQSVTGKFDHYVLDSYQKVVFMKPNRMTINAVVK